MKCFNSLLVFLILLMSCKHQDKQIKNDEKTGISVEFASFGKEIEPLGAKESIEMFSVYESLAISDTLSVKFTARVTDVCKAKGCWMKLKLIDGEEAMVKFKDYGFFVPKDITGKEVIVNGLAFVEEVSVEDQKHYAKDANKSEEELAKIIDTKKTYGFVADGVLIKE